MVMGLGKGRHSGRGAKSGIVAALDVGSTKIACLIAKPIGGREGSPQLKILGVGLHASRGVRSGAVVDINAAEDSIRAAVEQAEHQAGGNAVGETVLRQASSERGRFAGDEPQRRGLFCSDPGIGRYTGRLMVPHPRAEFRRPVLLSFVNRTAGYRGTNHRPCGDQNIKRVS